MNGFLESNEPMNDFPDPSDVDLVRDFMDAYIPKDHTTMINPAVYQSAMAAIKKIQSVVETVLHNSFGDDANAECSVSESGFFNENLLLKIRIDEYWLSVPSVYIWETVKILPDNFRFVVFPKADGSVELHFEFLNVKEILSLGKPGTETGLPEEV